MRPLRTKAELLAFAAQHAPSSACARAINEGRATIFGGVISPEGLPGWGVFVTSMRGNVWTFNIYCDEVNRRYKVRYR